MSNRELKQTPLDEWHRANGARMVEFGGWDMPVQYAAGILAEHLATRRAAGLFDVSHMGRFRVRGSGSLAFLQHVLSNDAAVLDPWQAQYTLIANEAGGVVDDAYLYRLDAGEDYLLVVNAGNREKDWAHLQKHAAERAEVVLRDETHQLGMIAFQGPLSEALLGEVVDAGCLPEPRHNAVSRGVIAGTPVLVARTGYTGEPICFELFVPVEGLVSIWSALIERGREKGVVPVGLGARDTLRLEAGMPLYGHEFGVDPEGNEIPALAVPLARVAVSLAEHKGPYVGRDALARQLDEVKRMAEGGAPSEILPRRIRKMAVLDRGVARHGDAVWHDGKAVGVVTSGTTTPYWRFDESGSTPTPAQESGRRAIALAYVDADLKPKREVEVCVRKRTLASRLVKSHGNSRQAPYFRPLLAAEMDR